jgi:hypothetical protein
MKYLFSITILVFCISIVSGQELSSAENQEKFFVQVVLGDTEDSTFAEIEIGLRNNPYVYMVRFDKITHGLFVITKDIQVFDRSVFNGWMGEQESLVDCYRDGIHGTDIVLPFNADFCNSIVE